MSEGAFIRSRYQSAGGNIHPIRVQPETLGLEIGDEPNDPPSGPVQANVPSAKVSLGKREFGLRPAIASIVFASGQTPTGYKVGGIIRVPLLNSQIRAAAVRGATGVYLEEPIEVVGVSAEQFR